MEIKKLTWEDKESEAGFNWQQYEGRVRHMRTLLEPGTESVLDFGAGVMFLKRLLPPEVKYYPVDLKKRFEETIVCDLNKKQFPDVHADVGFCSGILEYLEDMDWFAGQLYEHTDGVVLSYSVLEGRPDIADRRSRGWVNDFSMEELIACFVRNGFYVSKWEYSHVLEYQPLLVLKKLRPAALPDNFFCSGCGACAGVCPAGAMTMGQDEYGYYKPVFDSALCVGCGRCTEICPTIHPLRVNRAEPACFAAAMSDAERRDSSSGGVFPVLAKQFLREGGAVCGAAWTEELAVRHVLIEREEDLGGLRRSKYVQSDMDGSYRQVRDCLQAGRKVLFTGCPCQVAGLYAYLGGDREGLYTIDLICTQSPSVKFFQKYLEETFGRGNVEKYSFRDKENGWDVVTHRVRLKDGRELVRQIQDDPYQQAYHPRLMMPRHCEECRYCGFPRPGDITIGDFHEIWQHDESLNDGKGLSCVLVDSEKGGQLLDRLRPSSKVLEKTPLEWVTLHNRVRRQGFDAHVCRDTFYDLIRDHSFKAAADASLYWKRDVGIFGCWSERNYGSEVTYVALHRVVRSLGYSAVLFERPMDAQWHGSGNLELFRKDPTLPGDVAAPFPTKQDMWQLNDRCDIFMVGSDQIWPHYNNIAFGEVSYLDFINSSRKLIAYATSYGSDKWFGEESQRAENSYLLQRFDAVSVREHSGVELTKELFGVDAQWVLDPVFLCDRKEYLKLAEQSAFGGGRYIGAYILDVTEEKEKALRHVSQKLGLPLEIITDAKEPRYEQWSLPVNRDVCVEDWLKMFSQCEFVVTDSFHGMCFAVIFRKPFIAIVNNARGVGRFTDYGTLLGLMDRVVFRAEDVLKRDDLLGPVDYGPVTQILDREGERSLQWLSGALAAPKQRRGASGFDVVSRRLAGTQKRQREAQERLEEEHKRLEEEQKRQQEAQECLEEEHKRLEEEQKRRQEAQERLEKEQASFRELVRQGSERISGDLERLQDDVEGAREDIRQLYDAVKALQETVCRLAAEMQSARQATDGQIKKMGEAIQSLEREDGMLAGALEEAKRQAWQDMDKCLQIVEQDVGNRIDMLEDTVSALAEGDRR